ncbi:MAG TPA: hypothetical protein VMN37_10285 [Gemmatimonadales bacterium]|nr:hypothetical protein [Gemmatimonadales bacterium]
MTAVAERQGAVPPAPRSTLRPWLEEVHGAWMQEVLGVIDAARATGAGIWVRWGAVRYLDGSFAGRLQRSRGALERLRPHLAADAAARLWAVGELLDQLRYQLDRVVALHQTGDEFSALAVKFLRALGCWCREVEQALGGIEWTALPHAARAEVERLGEEEQAIGA